MDVQPIPGAGEPVVPAGTHLLRLYVSGSTTRSLLAIARLKALCERHLAGRYELEVVDIYQQPALAAEAQVVATPTLVRVAPAPLRRYTGPLDADADVLSWLGLDAAPGEDDA